MVISGYAFKKCNGYTSFQARLDFEKERERHRTVDERKVSFWILFQRGEREKGREEFLVFAPVK